MDNTLVRVDVTGRPIIERRAVSFSALDKFANCPRKYHAYDVAKIIKEPESPQMKEGHKVHRAMAEFIEHGTPLPPQYERYADWTTTMFTHNSDEVVAVERRMACTFDLTPCGYFDKQKKVWMRGVADLLVVNNLHALSVDWKTGKERDERYDLLPKNFQLRLAALLIFLHYPTVERITSKYVYLNEGHATQFDMHKDELRLFIPQVYDLAAGIQKAVRADRWPPRPSGLCKHHCGVTACEFHGKGG